MGCSASKAPATTTSRYAVESGQTEPGSGAPAPVTGAAEAPAGDYTDLGRFDVDKTEVPVAEVKAKDEAVAALERYAKAGPASRRRRGGGGLVPPSSATMQAGCMRDESADHDGDDNDFGAD